MNTLKESSTSIQNCRRCHITKWIVQLLNAEFDIKDEDRRWREICWMVLNTDCEGETVGSACAWCANIVVILEGILKANDSADEFWTLLRLFPMHDSDAATVPSKVLVEWPHKRFISMATHASTFRCGRFQTFHHFKLVLMCCGVQCAVYFREQAALLNISGIYIEHWYCLQGFASVVCVEVRVSLLQWLKRDLAWGSMRWRKFMSVFKNGTIWITCLIRSFVLRCFLVVVVVEVVVSSCPPCQFLLFVFFVMQADEGTEG